MSSGCSQPGTGDPYWFEWYVGLSYVISMLAGDNSIQSVTFQKSGLEGIDDVVVHRVCGLPTLCIQVKHKKSSTSNTGNLTFGSLVEKEGKGKSLIASLAAGWKQVAGERGVSPEVILYTNREMGSNRSAATYNGKGYKRATLGEFWDIVSRKLKSAEHINDVSFSDSNLETQWRELVDATALAESDILPFFRSLRIEAGAPSLIDKEAELIDRLKDEVCAGSQELASSVFSLLAGELRIWSTAAGNNVVTSDIARKCVCKLNRNPLERPIAVPLPNPIFPSRDCICASLCEKLKSSNSKVVFLRGRPGSGKTRLVSCLCERMSPRPIRFYAFKPLDVDTFSYSPDAGIVSSKELWSTLLNQLRDVPELCNEKPRIPIINEICCDDDLRNEVLRLAGILSKKRGSKTVIVIDGIDHAARATDKLTFLKHLPSTESIPDGVLFLLSGQPADLYSSYPQWLKDERAGVEDVDVPNIDLADILTLLKEKTNYSPDENLVLAHEIFNMTKGNTLSVVYAVHAIADGTNGDLALEKLRAMGLSDNIEEYYESIWQKANDEIQRHHGGGSNALSLIASSMHLLDGAVYPKLLCGAFPEAFSGEHVARRDISILSPLMKICDDGSAWPIHNDFRIFVSSKALHPDSKGYLDYSSGMLADAVMEMKDSLVKSCYAIRLLACSGRAEECIGLFDTSFVIDAVAHGVPWRILCEQAKTVYGLACEDGKLESVFRVQLALSTLSQINEHFEYWLERRPFLHFDGLVGMDYMVPPLSRETAALYSTMLDRCLWLLKFAECAEQSEELYGIWFSELTPLKAARILSDSNEGGRRIQQEDDSTLLMSAWGEFAAAGGIGYDEPVPGSAATPYVEMLLVNYRNAYVRGLLKWCATQGAIEGFPKIRISEEAALDMIRDTLIGTLPASHAARCEFFSRLASHSYNRASGTLAYVLCLSEGLTLPDLGRGRPLLHSREGGLHDREFSLELFAESFVFGYESNCDDFESMALDVEKAIAWIDDSNREYLSFIRSLRASACLGYSIGHSRVIESGTKESDVFREWSKAPSWPGFLTIETCTVPYIMFVSQEGAAFCKGALKGSDLEFFIDSNKPLCTKLRTLDHLQKVGSKIPERFIKRKYGASGLDLLVSQDAVETHQMLRPLLLACDGELARHCDEAILYGSARFTDHKDYSLANLVETFDALSAIGLATESQALALLGLDNAVTRSGDNRMSTALMKAVAEWAVDEGPLRLSRIRALQSEYKYDYSLVEIQLELLLSHVKSLDDVQAVFAGLLGHDPCCSPIDFENLRTHIKLCREKAAELGCERDFADSVCDIERAIEGAPVPQSSSQDIIKPSKGDCRPFGNRTDEEVKDAAFNKDVHSWDWEPVAEACLELEVRGFEKSEIYGNLVMARGAALANSGWVRYSASISGLIGNIAVFADDSSFYKLLAHKSKKLSEYGFGAASDDIAHIVLDRARSKSPELLEVMFELECDSKRRWITCNGKCDLPAMSQRDRNLPEPVALSGLIADILLDSVIANDPHRTENSVRGIVWGGLHVEGIKNRVCKALPNLDPYGRILLEKVLDRWIRAYPDDENIAICLSRLLHKVNRIDEACVLSKIVDAPGIILKTGTKDPDPGENGCSEIPSRIEDFLSLVEAYCDNDCRDIRNLIESCGEEESEPFIGRYMRRDDTFLPICRSDDYCQELIYSEICRGRWNSVPLYVPASMLMDPADVWAFSRIPAVKDPLAFGVSKAIELFEAGDITDARRIVEWLPMIEVEQGEICLGWKLYIPYGNKEEYEYYGTARVSSLNCNKPDNVIDREFGCYGLLSVGTGGRRSCFSRNSDSLCNVLAGGISMVFCDCEIFPSSLMRKFGFQPRADNPLIWIDGEGNRVAWFEQFTFPVENGYCSSAYYRQPRLWRWVCCEDAIEKAVRMAGCRIYWATESSNHIDQIRERYDMVQASEKQSPFVRQGEL